MNILMCFDSNYLEKAETMLYSLRLHNQGEISLYLINNSLTESECDSFEQFLWEKCSIKLVLIQLKEFFFDEFPVIRDQYAIEMYYRILAQFLLPQDLNRILWLDADIIIMKNIQSFYEQSFDNMLYVVCPDSRPNYVKGIMSKLQLPYDHIYFNSGVMLMNLNMLREQSNVENIIGVCLNLKDKLTCPDQDILNVLYSQKVKYDNWKKYNYQLIDIEDIPLEELSNICILHYTGSDKPWNYWQINSNSKFYWKIRSEMGYTQEAKLAYNRKLKDATVVFFKQIKEYIRIIKIILKGF